MKRTVEEITIMSLQSVPDGMGGFVTSEAPYWTTLARVTPFKGTRALEAGQIVNGTPYSITIRYRSDKQVTGAMYILWRGKQMQIHSIVNQDAAFKELLITAVTNA
jgi:SPP1 family predicted phage head-tail adaptor